MIIILLLWIPSAIRGSFRVKNLKIEIEILKGKMTHQKEIGKLREPYIGSINELGGANSYP
jgi:hypothetical protein